MKRRICVNCEAEISDSALICTNCGLPFKSYKYANNENIAQIIFKGNTYYNKEEYEKAFYCYKKAADSKDPIGFMKLGDCFRIAYHQQELNFQCIMYQNIELEKLNGKLKDLKPVERLIADYGKKAFELYRFSCEQIPNWSENRNRYLFMEMNIELIPKLDCMNTDKISKYLMRNILQSNLDCMGFDPFYKMIEANIDNNFDTLNMDCYFNYEKVLEHPRSDKYLKIDACMYIVSCILRYEYGSLNCPSNEELNLAKRCLYFAQANGFPIDAKKQFDDYMRIISIDSQEAAMQEEYVMYQNEESMRELEEQFAEEDAAETIRQWEIEQDDSMPHDAEREHYYNLYYNDDYDGDDEDY